MTEGSAGRGVARGKRERRLFPAGVLCFAVIACGPGPQTAEETIFRFVGAVQAEDLSGLRCLLAGAASAAESGGDDGVAFEVWARSRYEEYRTGRDRGYVDLGDDGIVLVKAYVLGKGTFYQLENVESAGPGRMTARTSVRFGYPEIDLSGWTPGTVFYMAGMPPGVVRVVRIPLGHEEITEQVLDTVTVLWSLRRESAGGGCPERWTVASVIPEVESATTVRATWVF